ncbi:MULTISPECIES: hypothetical protein [Bacillus]|nr:MULTISPECIES: hypothetical protein [Bacillus]EJS62386.1 hypothetical protein ICU_04979 [Bacillus cereus BAG2X1-1]EJS63745.1 hypothetical protein ICY_05220 [Bacillus cereus BAG2X1-3]MDH4423787.1 hypothetical protein [Bacillus cereus]
MKKMIFIILCSSFFLFTFYRIIDTPHILNFLFPGYEEEIKEA